MSSDFSEKLFALAFIVLASTSCKLLSEKSEDKGGSTTTATTTTASASPALSPQAAAKPKIVRINELEAKLPAKPPETLKPPSGPVKLGGSKPTLAVVWRIPESLDKHRYDLLDIRFVESGTTFSTCYLAMDSKPSELKPDDVSALETCSGFKYVMIIRPKAYTHAADTEGTLAFSAGAIDADVFVYDIDGAALLGGFAVKAKSSEKFKSVRGEMHPAAKDLGLNLQDAIAAKWEHLGKNTDFPKAVHPGQ